MNETELIGNEITWLRPKSDKVGIGVWILVGVAFVIVIAGLAATHSLPFVN